MTPQVGVSNLFFSPSSLSPSQIFALGTGNIQGMNQRLLPWLTERKGQRFGIISAFFNWIIKLLFHPHPTAYVRFNSVRLLRCCSRSCCGSHWALKYTQQINLKIKVCIKKKLTAPSWTNPPNIADPNMASLLGTCKRKMFRASPAPLSRGCSGLLG